MKSAVKYEAPLPAEAARAEEAGNGLPLCGGSTFAETWMTEYVEITNRLSTMKEKRSTARLSSCERTPSAVDTDLAVKLTSRSGMAPPSDYLLAPRARATVRALLPRSSADEPRQ